MSKHAPIFDFRPGAFENLLGSLEKIEHSKVALDDVQDDVNVSSAQLVEKTQKVIDAYLKGDDTQDTQKVIDAYLKGDDTQDTQASVLSRAPGWAPAVVEHYSAAPGSVDAPSPAAAPPPPKPPPPATDAPASATASPPASESVGTGSEGATGGKFKYQGVDSQTEDVEFTMDTDTTTAAKHHQRNEDINSSRVKDSMGFPEDGESGANWLSWLIKTSDHWLYAMAAINAVYEANKEALGLLGTLVASAVINLCLKTIFRDGRGGWRLTLGVVLVLGLMIGAYWSMRDGLSMTSRIVACVVFVLICVMFGLTLHARDKHHAVEQITRDKVGVFDGRRPRAGGRAGMAFEGGTSQKPYTKPKNDSPMLVANSVQQPVTGSYHMGCEGGQPQIGRVGLYGVADRGSPSVAMILGKMSNSYGMPSSHMQLWSAFIAYAVYRVTWGDVGRNLKKQGGQVNIIAKAIAWTVSVVILTIVGRDRAHATRCNSLMQVVVGFLAGASTGVIGYTMIDEEARF
jgi:hypothetical protein